MSALGAKHPEAARLLALRQRETARVPQWSAILRGSLVRYFLTCGNKNCRCHKAKRYRHGPYWYVSVSRAAGRSRLVLIREPQVPLARRGIADYKKLWKALCRISDLNLALLKAGNWRTDEPQRTRK